MHTKFIQHAQVHIIFTTPRYRDENRPDFQFLAGFPRNSVFTRLKKSEHVRSIYSLFVRKKIGGHDTGHPLIFKFFALEIGTPFFLEIVAYTWCKCLSHLTRHPHPISASVWEYETTNALASGCIYIFAWNRRCSQTESASRCKTDTCWATLPWTACNVSPVSTLFPAINTCGTVLAVIPSRTMALLIMMIMWSLYDQWKKIVEKCFFIQANIEYLLQFSKKKGEASCMLRAQMYYWCPHAVYEAKNVFHWRAWQIWWHAFK